MIQGYVEIYEDDGNSVTKIYEDKNLVAAGMGYNLALFFSNQETNRILQSYQMGYFQIGVCSVAFADQQTSNAPCFYTLASSVPQSLLGSDLDSNIKSLYYLYETPSFSRTAFASSLSMRLSSTKTDLIELTSEQRINNPDGSITHRVLLENNMAPNIAIKELGLYAKNPDTGYKIDRPILSAYKLLENPITKRLNNKLIIDWTLYFK